MGRPRTVSDAEVLAGVARALGRVGPQRLTLAEVARETGLAPPTLVQRFGSRHGLLLAFAAAAAEGAALRFAHLAGAGAGAVTALLDALVAMTAEVRSPEELANHLAMLQMDLADPELRDHAARHAAAVREGIAAALAAAAAAGALDHPSPARLAAAVHAVFNGSLLTWALAREGSLEPWLRRDLDTLLAPWRHDPEGQS